MTKILRFTLLSCLSSGLFACNSNDDPDVPQESSGGQTSWGGQPGSGGASGGSTQELTGGGGSFGGEEVGQVSGSTLVPAFVAQGHLGRLVMSCDEGRTWTADQANEVGTGTCWSGDNEIECDHDVGAGRGISFGSGYFFATFGWGTPSTVKRSADGIDWETVLSGEETQTFGGVGVQEDTIILATQNARLSRDHGATWDTSVLTSLAAGNVRRAGSAGTYFVLVGDGGDVAISRDAGTTWYNPTSMSGDCGGDIQTNGGIAFGGSTLLILGGNGLACSSTDGGLNFEATDLGTTVSSHLVWSGHDFVVYAHGNAYRSEDGIDWTTTAMSPSIPIGAISVSSSGTFVGIDGGWGLDNWYEGQNFYRSEDGIVWETLEPGTFTGGHPVRNIAFGYVTPSDECPAPR